MAGWLAGWLVQSTRLGLTSELVNRRGEICILHELDGFSLLWLREEKIHPIRLAPLAQCSLCFSSLEEFGFAVASLDYVVAPLRNSTPRLRLRSVRPETISADARKYYKLSSSSSETCTQLPHFPYRRLLVALSGRRRRLGQKGHKHHQTAAESSGETDLAWILRVGRAPKVERTTDDRQQCPLVVSSADSPNGWSKLTIQLKCLRARHKGTADKGCDDRSSCPSGAQPSNCADRSFTRRISILKAAQS